MDRKFYIHYKKQSLEISRAEAYALETSGYIVPSPSTEGIWNYKLAPDFDISELNEALRMFDRARKMFGEFIDES